MTDHVCDAGDFDRSICPEPCGRMHSYCTYCGARQDPCAHDRAVAAADRLFPELAAVLPVFREAQADAYDEGWGDCKRAIEAGVTLILPDNPYRV